MRFWLKQIAIAIDQLINALIGGYADETLSSHAYRLHRDNRLFGFMRHVLDTLFWFDADHCRESFLAERTKLQLPPEYRNGAAD